MMLMSDEDWNVLRESFWKVNRGAANRIDHELIADVGDAPQVVKISVYRVGDKMIRCDISLVTRAARHDAYSR